MKIRVDRAVWLLVLGALAAFEIQSHSRQAPGGPAQFAPSDVVTLRDSGAPAPGHKLAERATV